MTLRARGRRLRIGEVRSFDRKHCNCGNSGRIKKAGRPFQLKRTRGGVRQNRRPKSRAQHSAPIVPSPAHPDSCAASDLVDVPQQIGWIFIDPVSAGPFELFLAVAAGEQAYA
jgi:hypothetical protein